MADIKEIEKALSYLRCGAAGTNLSKKSFEYIITQFELLLQEKLERTKGCNACKNDSITIHIPAFKAMAKFNEHMNHRAYDMKIKPPFCPHCGRDLKQHEINTDKYISEINSHESEES